MEPRPSAPTDPLDLLKTLLVEYRSKLFENATIYNAVLNKVLESTGDRDCDFVIEPTLGKFGEFSDLGFRIVLGQSVAGTLETVEDEDNPNVVRLSMGSIDHSTWKHELNPEFTELIYPFEPDEYEVGAVFHAWIQAQKSLEDLSENLEFDPVRANLVFIPSKSA